MKKQLKNWSNIWKMYKIFFIGLLFFVACEKVEFSSETISDKDLPTKQAENVWIVTTNHDKIEEEMTAVHFDEYEDGLIVADTVFIKNFNEDGSLVSSAISTVFHNEMLLLSIRYLIYIFLVKL